MGGFPHYGVVKVRPALFFGACRHLQWCTGLQGTLQSRYLRCRHCLSVSAEAIRGQKVRLAVGSRARSKTSPQPRLPPRRRTM